MATTADYAYRARTRRSISSTVTSRASRSCSMRSGCVAGRAQSVSRSRVSPSVKRVSSGLLGDPSRISAPIAEFARALRPGGTLLLGYFDSADTIEPFDHAVVQAYRWPVAALQTVLEGAGFVVVETHRRAERGRRPVGAVVCDLSG